jgi:hypothetical protein
MEEERIKEIYELIRKMRRVAGELKKKSEGFQAVERNTDRILANVKMLELNISDVMEI